MPQIHKIESTDQVLDLLAEFGSTPNIYAAFTTYNGNDDVLHQEQLHIVTDKEFNIIVFGGEIDIKQVLAELEKNHKWEAVRKQQEEQEKQRRRQLWEILKKEFGIRGE